MIEFWQHLFPLRSKMKCCLETAALSGILKRKYSLNLGGPLNAETNLLLYHPLINISSHVSTSISFLSALVIKQPRKRKRERYMRDDFKLSSFVNKRLNMADQTKYSFRAWGRIKDGNRKKRKTKNMVIFLSR